ncbi:MAG: hypothetical protein ACYC0Y_27665 [Pirellulales bacterium]
MLEGRGLRIEPTAQIGGQIGANRNRVALPVLFVGRVERHESRIGVEVELPHGDRSQLAFAKPGQHQRLVGQRAFPAEPFQLGDEVRALRELEPSPGRRGVEVLGLQREHRPGIALEFRVFLRLADGLPAILGQWPAACHVQQPQQLGLGHRPALPAAVALFIGLGHSRQWVRQKPAILDTPVAERNPRFAVAVAGRGAHAFALTGGKPAFQGRRVEVHKLVKAAFRGNPVESASRIIEPAPSDPLGGLMFHEVADVRVEGRVLVVDCRGLRRRENAAADLLGALLQLGQDRFGGRLVAATGGHLDHQPRAVAVLGRVGRGLHEHPLGAVGPRGQLAGLGLAFVPPPGKPLARSDDDLRAGGYRLGERGFVDGPHDSLRLSFLDQFQAEVFGQSIDLGQ